MGEAAKVTEHLVPLIWFTERDLTTGNKAHHTTRVSDYLKFYEFSDYRKILDLPKG
jgi:hypothetical protein